MIIPCWGRNVKEIMRILEDQYGCREKEISDTEPDR